MPTRGLIGSLLVGFWIAFSLVDCSSFSRVAFTRAEQDVASIPGIPDARSGRMIQPEWNMGAIAASDYSQRACNCIVTF
jgi:hypothetical protein